MINGSGFLVVGDASGQYFTRDGALRVDDSGNLCIKNGMKVRGWGATLNDKGEYEITKGEVQNISLAASSSSSPKMTTKASLSGNICATSDTPTETSVSFYDSLGNYYKATFQLKKVETTDGTSKYEADTSTLKITDANNKPLSGYTAKIEGTLIFDNTGKLKSTTSGTDDTLTLSFTEGTPKPTAKLDTIKVDCSDVSQYASKDTLKSKTDGNAAGTMNGYSIGADGIITASYTNGDQRVVAQVVVAEFDNPAGLEKVGSNLFKVTANSGDFDGVGTSGEFSTGCLEMSNVDLSAEFTQMITTQRGFQANSRIISVSDEMLQELTNLKR